MKSSGREHRRAGRGGFTLIEVLAAGLSVSVLAIAMGSILFFSYSALARNAERIELQRDATLAHDMISRAGQGSAPGEVSVATGSVTFGTNAFRSTRMRFVQNGNNLLYHANVDGGSPKTVINGRLTSFHVAVAGSRLMLRLAVTGAGETLIYSNSITMRN